MNDDRPTSPSDPRHLSLIVAVPRNELISLNGRAHFMAVHRQTTALVDRGHMTVRQARLRPFTEPVRCDVFVHYPAVARRRDVSNLMGTVKPLVDGFTRAGLLSDDDDEHLHGPFLHPAPEGMLRPGVGLLSTLADAHVFTFEFAPWTG